jgi:glycosyltransferase involved in cell wall biosynthesis
MTFASTDSKTPALPCADARSGQVHVPSELAVIIPCYNEAKCLADLKAALIDLRSALDGECRLEVLLVDDGSSDDTPALLRQHFGSDDDVTVLRHTTNLGIASAIATGLRHARAEIVASLDADLTYDPMQLLPMLRLLVDDVALVVASPYHPQGKVEGVPRWRLCLSRIASRLYRLILRNKLHTYTSCVRVYRRSSVAEMPLRNGGFAGVVELVCRLDQRGGKIVEHPAVLTLRKAGHSKMRIAHTVLAHARLMAWAARLRVFGSRSDPTRRTSLLPS